MSAFLQLSSDRRAHLLALALNPLVQQHHSPDKNADSPEQRHPAAESNDGPKKVKQIQTSQDDADEPRPPVPFELGPSECGPLTGSTTEPSDPASRKPPSSTLTAPAGIIAAEETAVIVVDIINPVSDTFEYNELLRGLPGRAVRQGRAMRAVQIYSMMLCTAANCRCFVCDDEAGGGGFTHCQVWTVAFESPAQAEQHFRRLAARRQLVVYRQAIERAMAVRLASNDRVEKKTPVSFGYVFCCPLCDKPECSVRGLRCMDQWRQDHLSQSPTADPHKSTVGA